MCVLVVDAYLMKQAVDLLAGIHTELGQVAQKTLAGQAVVVRERSPRLFEQRSDLTPGKLVCHFSSYLPISSDFADLK
jgi:hypothetical protein